jgi:hypothetical protein
MRSVLGTAILIEDPGILRIRVSGDETLLLVRVERRVPRDLR